MKKFLRKYLVPFLVFWIYRIHYWTWRFDVYEPPELLKKIKKGEGFLLAHWHGDEIALLQCINRYKLAAMVSKSSDGELMAYVVRKLGGYPSRGSSSRSGVSALKELIKICRTGRATSIAVDGPKGPIYIVKPGVLEISRFTGLNIFPISSHCDRAYHFNKSWNKTYLPKPFARVQIYIGKPLPVITKQDNLKDGKLTTLLGEQINSAKQQALGLIAKQ